MSGIVSRLFAAVAVALAVTAAPARAQLLVSSYFDSAIRQYDINTGALQATIVQPNFTFSGTVAGPSGMTIGPDDNLYVSSQANNTIVKIDLHVANPTPTTFITLPAGYQPAGLRFGGDNNLYVSRNGGQQAATGSGTVDRFNGTTGAPWGTVLTGLTQPSNITVNGTTLYVSDSGSGTVVKVGGYTAGTNLTGTPYTTFNPALGPYYAAGTTFHTVGNTTNFYVADLGAGSVLKYDEDGSNPTVHTHTNALLQGSLYNQYPSDVLFRADGRLLTANLGPNQGTPDGSVYVFGPDGTYESTLISGIYSASEFAINPVPEPAWLLGFAGAGLVWRHRRQVFSILKYRRTGGSR